MTRGTSDSGYRITQHARGRSALATIELLTGDLLGTASDWEDGIRNSDRRKRPIPYGSSDAACPTVLPTQIVRVFCRGAGALSSHAQQELTEAPPRAVGNQWRVEARPNKAREVEHGVFVSSATHTSERDRPACSQKVVVERQRGSHSRRERLAYLLDLGGR